MPAASDLGAKRSKRYGQSSGSDCMTFSRTFDELPNNAELLQLGKKR